MALEMRAACKRCSASLAPNGEADICRDECTFCPGWNTSRGTHRGTFWGVAPTGQSVMVSEIPTYRVANGRVAGQWCLGDELGRMQQLGAVLTRSTAS